MLTRYFPFDSLTPAEDSVPEWIGVSQVRVYASSVILFVLNAGKVNEKVFQIHIPPDMPALMCVKGIEKAQRRHVCRLLLQIRAELATIAGQSFHQNEPLRFRSLQPFYSMS